MPPKAPRTQGLIALLAGHVPADVTEAAHLAGMRDLCESVADPFARTTYVPGHFTASAFVLSPDGDALLLIFHEKLRRWLQPGGHVEPEDEQLLAAALREVREEVGIVDLRVEQPLPLDLDIHRIPARKSEPEHAHFDVRFLFRAHSLAFRAGSDATDARWVPLDRVTEELTDESVMRAVAKLARCAR